MMLVHQSVALLHFLSALVLLATVSTIAHAQERRVALVIGNVRYDHAPRLDGAGRDTQAIARALRDLGFNVDERSNLDLAGMLRTLEEFEAKARHATVALVYFAGHGLQLTRGTTGDNYLVPTDAQLQDARKVEFETIPLSRMLEWLEGAGSRIVILDACRNNPLAQQMRNPGAGRSVGRGLAPLASSERGTLVAFSTAPGEIAADDAGGGNGPFASSLLRHLPTPGLEVRQMLTRVRAETARLTGGRQVPWNNDGLFEEVYLGLSRAPDPVTPRPTPLDPETVELAFWQSIQGSRDVADFDAYLSQYPRGRFAALARNQVARLLPPSSGQQALLQQPATPAPTRGFPVPAGQSFRDEGCPGGCPEMVVVPAGSFAMDGTCQRL